MPTCYRYQDKEYASFFALRKALVNISFPANLDDVLSELGVEIVTIPAS